MRTFFQLSLILFSLWPLPLVGHHEESIDFEQNKQRYEDLWNDEHNVKFLKVFLDPGYGHAKQRSPEEWEKINWVREQGDKAFPILLEMLRREPNDDLKMLPHPWIGVERKMHVLSWVLRHPNGDQMPFVDEVRRQLPEWAERQIANHDTHTGFIREALKLLARVGDESDVPLIESFLDDVNRNNKHYAERSLASLKERLARESTKRDRPTRNGNVREKHRQISFNQPDKEGFSEGKQINWLFTVCGIITFSIIFLLIKTWKGKSAS